MIVINSVICISQDCEKQVQLSLITYGDSQTLTHNCTNTCIFKERIGYSQNSNF